MEVEAVVMAVIRTFMLSDTGKRQKFARIAGIQAKHYTWNPKLNTQ